MSSTGTKTPLSHIKPLVRPLLNRARSLRKTAANWSDAALWRVLANKPGLNAVSAVSHVERLLPRDAATFDVTGGRVHVRIAFHYVPWRLKYLIETVEAASRLPFEEIDIWIDTNTSQLKREAARIPESSRLLSGTSWITLSN